MGRYIVKAKVRDEEVIGEEFKIDGEDAVFIVHRSLDDTRGNFTSTHVDTGFAIGWGESINEAIMHGTKRWLEQSPEKLAASIARAHEMAAERDCVRLEAGAA